MLLLHPVYTSLMPVNVISCNWCADHWSHILHSVFPPLWKSYLIKSKTDETIDPIQKQILTKQILQWVKNSRWLIEASI